MSQATSDSRQLERVEIARRISSIERGNWLAAVDTPGPPRRSRVIGITGVPGSGKSTLVDALVALYRKASDRVAVIAVDPSSPVTGGALLGDRVRMNRHASDEAVFIRSMGSRGRMDGLGPAVQDSCRLLTHRGYDPVLIETVGVGQVELGVVACSDIRVLVLAPAWGDYVQAAKAGLIEMVDLVVINKSDLPGAANLLSDISDALRHRSGPPIRVVGATATQGENGVGAVRDAIEEIWQGFGPEGLRARRLDALASEMHSRAIAAFSGGPMQRAVTDGVAMRLAESVYAGTATAADAARTLLLDAVQRAQPDSNA